MRNKKKIQEQANVLTDLEPNNIFNIENNNLESNTKSIINNNYDPKLDDEGALNQEVHSLYINLNEIDMENDEN